MIAGGAMAPYDLVYTHVMIVPNDVTAIGRLKTAWDETTKHSPPAFGLFDLKGFWFAGAASYFVNPRSRAKVRALLQETLVGAELRQPVDLLYRSAIWDGRLRGACVFPFLTTLSPEAAVTAQTRERDRATAAVDLLTTAFYADLDLETAVRRAETLADDRTDPHLDLLATILRGILASPLRT